MSDASLALEQRGADAVRSLWNEFCNGLIHHRGGEALLVDLGGREALDGYYQRGELWTMVVDGNPAGFAILKERQLRALFVSPLCRRQGLARRSLQLLCDAQDGPRDGWALPGDRATKSLYEAMGWKARLLTMRGA